MDAPQGAVPVPQIEVLPDRAARREVLWQGLPLAPRPEHIEDGVEHLAHVDRPRTPAAFGRPDQRRNQRPFCIGQIARVAQSVPIRSGTMLGIPHGSPRVDSGAAHEITTDSSDSTSFRLSDLLDGPFWLGCRNGLAMFANSTTLSAAVTGRRHLACSPLKSTWDWERPSGTTTQT